MSFYDIIRDIRSCESASTQLNIKASGEGVKDLILIASVFHTTSNKIVIVIPAQKDLEKWVNRMKWLAQGYSNQEAEILPLPYVSNYGSDRFLDHRPYQIQRLAALTCASFSGKKTVYVTTFTSLMQLTRGLEDFRLNIKVWSVNAEVDSEELFNELISLGYHESPTVETEGLFAIRGGIVDVFPPGSHHPVRIEIFLDRIKSIRFFNRENQKSINEISEIVLGPAREFFTSPTDRDELVQNFFDQLMVNKTPVSISSLMIEKFKNQENDNECLFFLPKVIPNCDSTMRFFTENAFYIFPEGMEKAFKDHQQQLSEFNILAEEDRAKRRIVNSVESIFSTDEMDPKVFFDTGGCVELDASDEHGRCDSFEVPKKYSLVSPILIEKKSDDPLENWIKAIRELSGKGMNIRIMCQNPDRIDRIYYLLVGHDIVTVERRNRNLKEVLIGDTQSQNTNADIEIVHGFLSEAVSLQIENLALIPDFFLLGIVPRARGKLRRDPKNAFQSFSDLVPSNLVVHFHHGVGRYKGLNRMCFGGVESEFLVIEYAGNDKIYLPVDRLNALSRYDSVSDHDRIRSLDKLGGSFDQKKRRVKAETQEFAKFLISQQAQRSLARGITFGQIPDTYYRLEADFPYEETDDQLKAIEEVEADLVSGRPMDRLICGDVGFGKTEVAIRATMRAVLEGYQTLIFVPTTLLCQQHFTTFSHRMEKYAVRVAQINRFIGSRLMTRALEDFSSGKVDVLIGTHMLLTKEIKPKRLGLIIVDEEQRFGVQHKEQLKKIRSNAHIISLSATPIPRTLHQALLGLKEISVIATPPRQRLPIKTYISPFDPDLVKRAIDQELRRGGQVFFVHNRVEEIEAFAEKLGKIVSDARIAMAHGQMPEHQLERIVRDFIEKRYDILLCTTIIEAGVDMPNVNTLMINKADRFGLAQLYQMRGRVGRSHLQAYAYLFTSPEVKISQESRSRLNVIAGHQELGAGFHIANRDLEIRGAGDLLGEAQSGHVFDVGLETYRQLLLEAISELNGKFTPRDIEVELKLPVKVLIPEGYIAAEKERLRYYKEIFSTSSEEELEGILEGLRDRYGNPPTEIFILFKFAMLKIKLKNLGISSMIYRGSGLECWFSEITPDTRKNILALLDQDPDRYRPLPKEGLFIAVDLGKLVDNSSELLDKIAIEISSLKRLQNNA